MEFELTIRRRTIRGEELDLIQTLIHEEGHRGRTYISEELCRLWNWRQTNGKPKEVAARELLRRLEAKGLLQLPARQSRGCVGHKPQLELGLEHNAQSLEGNLKSFHPVELRLAQDKKEKQLYVELIRRHHYLGHSLISGAGLKYIAYIQNKPAGCLGWSWAAWKVACRDRWIGWDEEQRQKNLPLIVNNTRFLILPWVKIPHLASHLLGKNIRVLSEDWQRIYGDRIVLAETFVDIGRFRGTCYKAANWTWVGNTQGRGKWDRNHSQQGKSVKAIFVMALSKDYRMRLLDG